MDAEASFAQPRVTAADLCAPFVAALFVSGASVSVVDHLGHQSTVCASDSLAARAESLQFELGEGPRWEALRTGRPVLCMDITRGEPSAWPMFTESARALGIAAVFAFPMKLGAATVGVVDMHSLTPRRLDAHQVSLASSMADRIAAAAVGIALRAADEAASHEHELARSLRREVHQATGMIQAQLDLNATDAFARLRSHAFATGTPIETIAADVVARRLDFSSLSD